MNAGKNDQRIQSYFEGRGFERFERIHGGSAGERNRFQNIVRAGHSMTRDVVLEWLRDDRNLEGLSLCDAGCGVGTISIPLAQAGARVHAVDFSDKMIEAAKVRGREFRDRAANLEFEAQNILHLSGLYDAVLCIDVFARYPTQRVLQMLTHLCSLSKSRVIISFTPKKMFDRAFLRIGNRYASRHSIPLLYTHREEVIVKALQAMGFEIARRKVLATRFNVYFCTLLEAVRRSDERGEKL